MTKAEKILDTIKDICRGEAITSAQSARNFYEAGILPNLLADYLFEENEYSKNEAARRLGISSSSLKRILDGRDISENMIFRIQNYFERTVEIERMPFGQIEDIRREPWKITDAVSVQDAISAVSLSLSALHKAVSESNTVGSAGSPINALQKVQLIALLEAMLASLKAPVVKEGETKGFFSWLTKIAKRGAEKGLEKGVSDALSDAIDTGENLVSELARQPGISDLDKLMLNFDCDA